MMPRWEHCKLEDFSAELIGQTNTPHTITMTLYKADGEVQTNEQQFPEDACKEHWDKTIAQLGARGWELVNVRVDERDDPSIGGYAVLVEYIFKRQVAVSKPPTRTPNA
ncbi:MAG: hypothetical protein JXB47_12375 [Anaerolineae bacterium]|nr:hypothetical protein [Anaerolineae bacterium]